MLLSEIKSNSFLLDRLNHSGKQIYHKQGYHGQNVVICVIDTGCNPHNEINGKVINMSSSIADTKGHGTSMASLVVGNEVGMAPDAKLLIYKREDEYLYSVVNGLKFARNWRGANGEKVNIVSLSVSSAQNYGGIYDEIKACESAGILVVCSSGNTGQRDITYPASFPEPLTVGSCTNKLEIATFESSGDQIDICWYGTQIPSANYLKADDYTLIDATSPSTAIVAGLCALYYSKYFAMFKAYPTPQEAKNFMMMQSVDLGAVGKDVYFGWGFATLTGRIHKKIELQINSNQMKVNGYSQIIPQCPIISQTGSTLIPLRAPMEAVGFSVEWINDGQRIILTN